MAESSNVSTMHIILQQFTEIFTFVFFRLVHHSKIVDEVEVGSVELCSFVLYAMRILWLVLADQLPLFLYASHEDSGVLQAAAKTLENWMARLNERFFLQVDYEIF